MIGERIGHFNVIARLGRGGMGEVYRGEHESIQTPVAIKVLHTEISADTQHVQRFFNEARVVSRIKHAGVVKIFDVGFHGANAYLIMELLEGESLAQRIERCGRLSPAQIGDIGRQTASVLAATHKAGITHRDLKPDNIFLVQDADLADRERVKVLDFGIAKLSGTLAAASPHTIGTMGTPAYMAPEQWGDSSLVDWRADAYSLGCVTFEMATGRPPFSARTIAEAYTQHAQAAVPSPRNLASDTPVDLDRLVVQLLAKQPEARGRSMDDIAKAFEGISGNASLPLTLAPLVAGPRVTTPLQTTLSASSGAIAVEPKRRGSGKRIALGALVAAAMAAVTIAVILIITSSRESSPPPAVEPATLPAVEHATTTPPAPTPVTEPAKTPAVPAAASPPVPIESPSQPAHVEASPLSPPASPVPPPRTVAVPQTSSHRVAATPRATPTKQSAPPSTTPPAPTPSAPQTTPPAAPPSPTPAAPPLPVQSPAPTVQPAVPPTKPAPGSNARDPELGRRT